jgi:hypothetical protein
MEANEMSKYDDTKYILTKDKNGEKFLCPINSGRGHSDQTVELNDDCIEEDVVRRYAGNINVE